MLQSLRDITRFIVPKKGQSESATSISQKQVDTECIDLPRSSTESKASNLDEIVKVETAEDLMHEVFGKYKRQKQREAGSSSDYQLYNNKSLKSKALEWIESTLRRFPLLKRDILTTFCEYKRESKGTDDEDDDGVSKDISRFYQSMGNKLFHGREASLQCLIIVQISLELITTEHLAMKEGTSLLEVALCNVKKPSIDTCILLLGQYIEYLKPVSRFMKEFNAPYKRSGCINVCKAIVNLILSYMKWHFEVLLPTNNNPLFGAECDANMLNLFESNAATEVPQKIAAGFPNFEILNLLKLLRIFSRIRKLIKLIEEESNMRLLVIVMKNSLDLQDYQKEISALFANLAGNKEPRGVMKRLGVLEVMVRNLKTLTIEIENQCEEKDPMNVEEKGKCPNLLETETCAVLANLAGDDALAKDLLSLQVVPVLHKLLCKRVMPNGSEENTYSSNRKFLFAYYNLVIQSFHLLTHLLRVNSDCLKGFNFAMLVDRIVDRLLSYLSSSSRGPSVKRPGKSAYKPYNREESDDDTFLGDIATACCNLIGTMTFRKTDFYHHEKSLCRGVLKILSNFPNERIILITCCFAISHLLVSQVEVEVGLIIELGIIPIILQGILNNPHIASFQGTCLYTLSLLTPLGDIVSQSVIKNNGILIISGAMENAFTMIEREPERRKKKTLKKENPDSEDELSSDEFDFDSHVVLVADHSPDDTMLNDDYDDDEDDDEIVNQVTSALVREINEEDAATSTDNAKNQKRTRYPHSILALTFGSILLWGLFLIEEGKTIIEKAGIIALIYKSLDHVKGQSDLEIVIHQILFKLTISIGSHLFHHNRIEDNGFLVQWRSRNGHNNLVPSLKEICLVQLANDPFFMRNLMKQSADEICSSSKSLSTNLVDTRSLSKFITIQMSKLDIETETMSTTTPPIDHALPEHFKSIFLDRKNYRECHNCSMIFFDHSVGVGGVGEDNRNGPNGCGQSWYTYYSISIKSAAECKSMEYCCWDCVQERVPLFDKKPLYIADDIPNCLRVLGNVFHACK